MSDEAATADLTEQLARLEGQLTELHAEMRRLGVATSLPVDRVDPPPTPAAYAWLGALEAPVRRRPQARRRPERPWQSPAAPPAGLAPWPWVRRPALRTRRVPCMRRGGSGRS